MLGSSEWREEYGKRVDRLIKTLKRKGIALYWVGLPIMRRSEVNEPAQVMNDIAREKAYLNGIKFIDIQAHFADEAGNYAPYGPDITGKQRLLREADGVLFTAAGNRKLALFVEQEIKRDLNQAKNERAIPLAGNEAEQKRVNALRPRTADRWRALAGRARCRRPTTARADSRRLPRAREAPVADTSNDQKADNGRITLKSIGAGGREESVTVDIPRPAIPSAVIALMTRKELSDRPSQMGDVVADDVGDGLVVLSSITPAATTGSGPSPPARPQPQPLLSGADQGRAPAAQAGPRRRFLLAAGRARDGAGASAPPAKRLPRPAEGRLTAQLRPPDVIPDSRRAERGMRPVTFSCCRSGRGSRFQSLGGNDGMLLANLKKQRGRSEATPVRSVAMCRKGGSCRPPLD